MPTVEESPCPVCSATETLSLAMELVAKPLGSFSLSGQQMKVSATSRPVLSCSECGLRLVGRLDADGRHVTFPASG